MNHQRGNPNCQCVFCIEFRKLGYCIICKGRHSPSDCPFEEMGTAVSRPAQIANRPGLLGIQQRQIATRSASALTQHRPITQQRALPLRVPQPIPQQQAPAQRNPPQPMRQQRAPVPPGTNECPHCGYAHTIVRCPYNIDCNKQCRLCKARGHISKNCEAIIRLWGHQSNVPGIACCAICGSRTHRFRECTTDRIAQFRTNVQLIAACDDSFPPEAMRRFYVFVANNGVDISIYPTPQFDAYIDRNARNLPQLFDPDWCYVCWQHHPDRDSCANIQHQLSFRNENYRLIRVMQPHAIRQHLDAIEFQRQRAILERYDAAMAEGREIEVTERQEYDSVIESRRQKEEEEHRLAANREATILSAFDRDIAMGYFADIQDIDRISMTSEGRYEDEKTMGGAKKDKEEEDDFGLIPGSSAAAYAHDKARSIEKKDKEQDGLISGTSAAKEHDKVKGGDKKDKEQDDLIPGSLATVKEHDKAKGGAKKDEKPDEEHKKATGNSKEKAAPPSSQIPPYRYHVPIGQQEEMAMIGRPNHHRRYCVLCSSELHPGLGWRCCNFLCSKYGQSQ